MRVSQAFPKAPSMGKDMPDEDAVLAVSAELWPMRGDRVIESQAAALDLLQKGN